MGFWTAFFGAFNDGLMRAWVWASGIAGVLAIIGGIIVWRLPKWEATMKDLLWAIPLGIIILLIIVNLFLMPYTIYKSRQSQINTLQEQLDTARQSYATPDELLPSRLSGLSIRVSDLTRESNTVRNKVFDDCYIYGPAVAVITGTTEIRNNNFDGSPDSIFIITTNQTVWGTIVLDNCIFTNCKFSNVGFIGDATTIAKIKAGFIQTQ